MKKKRKKNIKKRQETNMNKIRFGINKNQYRQMKKKKKEKR